MNIIFLPVTWGLISLALLILSYFKIKKSGKRISFIYKWGFVFGAFVWEDLLVFSIFNLAISILVLQQRNLLPGMFLFVIFWVVRHTGETAYFMLQQFLEPKHSPHEIDLHFDILRRFFGKISTQQGFIIMQVFHQACLVVSLYALILLLKYWPDIYF